MSTYEQDLLSLMDDASFFADDPLRYGNIGELQNKEYETWGALIVQDPHYDNHLDIINLHVFKSNKYRYHRLVGHIPPNIYPSTFHITLLEPNGWHSTFVVTRQDTITDALNRIHSHLAYEAGSKLFSFQILPNSSVIYSQGV